MSADFSAADLAEDIKDLRQQGWVNPDSTIAHLLQLLGYDEKTRWTDVAECAMSRLTALVSEYAGEDAEKIYLALGVLDGYEYTGADKIKERREKYFLTGYPHRKVQRMDDSMRHDENRVIGNFAKNLARYMNSDSRRSEIAQIITNAPDKLRYIKPVYPYRDYRGNRKQGDMPATPPPQEEPADTPALLPMVVTKHTTPRDKPTRKPKQQKKPPKQKGILSRHKKTTTRAAVITLVVLLLSSAFPLLRSLNPTPSTSTSTPAEDSYYDMPPNDSILPMIIDSTQLANYGPLPTDSEDPADTVSETANHNFLVAKALYERGEFSDALGYLAETLDEQIKVSGAMSIEVARVYAALGYTYNCMGQFAQARDNFNYAIAIITESGDEYWQEAGRLYYNRALSYQGLYELDRALADLQEVGNYCYDKDVTSDILDYRFSIGLLRGRIIISQENWRDAIFTFDEALLIKATNDPRNKQMYATSGTHPPLYSIPISTAYKGLQGFPFNFYFADAELAYILCCRGFAYLFVNDFDRATADTNMAMEIIATLPNSQQAILSACYLNLHLIYFQQSRFDPAFEYINEAIANSTQWLGEQHPFTALMYEYKGVSLEFLKRYDEALECHLAAYKVFVKLDDQIGMDYNAEMMQSIFEKQQRKGSFEQWLESQH